MSCWLYSLPSFSICAFRASQSSARRFTSANKAFRDMFDIETDERLGNVTFQDLMSDPPLPEHFRVEISFKDHYRAKNAYPGIIQTGPSSVLFEADDWMDVLRMLDFVL